MKIASVSKTDFSLQPASTNFKWMISPPAIRIPARKSVIRSSEILHGACEKPNNGRIHQVAAGKNPRAALRCSSSSARRKFRAS
jgi:hypothetical protein